MVVRGLMRFAAVVAVVLVGAGACAFEPRTVGSGNSPPAAAPSSGVSASPAPDQETGNTGGQVQPPPTVPTTGPPSPKPSKPAPKPPTACALGDHHREVEGHLAQLGGFGAITVDGKQSAADCAAIKKFQQRYGIRPAEGRAGPTTLDVAKRLAGTRTSQCQAGSGTTVCVNLTLQTMWVLRNGSVVMPPTVTRTGMAGFRTPAGTFTIDRKNIKEWSNPYEVWLPYWQHFHSGMGFHETTTYIHDMPIGSHGCVNLLHADAVKLWSLAGVGTRVVLFGHRTN